MNAADMTMPTRQRQAGKMGAGHVLPVVRAEPAVLPVLVAGDAALRYLQGCGVLPDADFPATFIESGERVLGWLAAHDCALLVASLDMPAPDGWALLRRLRERPALAALPVLLIGRMDADALGALDGLGPVMVLHEQVRLDAVEIRHRMLSFARETAPSVSPSSRATTAATAAGATAATPVFARARPASMPPSRPPSPAPARPAGTALTAVQSRVLAEVTHELRTPMQGIVSLADLALNTPSAPSQREYLRLVKQSAENLLVMVNDILDHARAEAGCLALRPVPFALRDCVADSLGALDAVAAEKGLSITWEVAPDIPPSLVGDPQRLRQVLLNLVGNAIKFTDQGRIEVAVDVESRGDEQLCCRFAVRDSGTGIPPEQVGTIFEPFRQGGDAGARHQGGVGLGLSIARDLVALMDGRLWVESVPGDGSTFHFTACFGLTGPSPANRAADSRVDAGGTADMEAVAAVAAAQAAAGVAGRLLILLVEDDAVSRQVAEHMLVAAGHEVIAVADGDAALAALAGGAVDVVLTDLRLPGLSGAGLTERIRAREAATDRAARLPVLVMSAYAGVAERERCLAAGADDCLVKPVAADTLCRAVARLAGAGARRAAPPVDIAALMERIDHDRDFLREIVDAFVPSAGKRLRGARQALLTGDRAGFAESVHALGGMLRSLAATRAAGQAARLENRAADGPAERLQTELAGLAYAVREVGESLQRLAGSAGDARRARPAAGRRSRQPAAGAVAGA